MRKPSLSKRIERYCRKNYPSWIPSMTLERLALQEGYKSSNAGRRCREMQSGKLSDGKTCPIVLERREVEGVVEYRYLMSNVQRVSYRIPELDKEIIMYQPKLI